MCLFCFSRLPDRRLLQLCYRKPRTVHQEFQLAMEYLFALNLSFCSENKQPTQFPSLSSPGNSETDIITMETQDWKSKGDIDWDWGFWGKLGFSRFLLFFALGSSKAASGSHVLMLSLQLEYHREPPGGRKVEELSISAFKKSSLKSEFAKPRY